MLRDDLDDHGLHVNCKRVQRLMRLMGIEALPLTTQPNKLLQVYPYLLKGFGEPSVDRPASPTVRPMRKGVVYLDAVSDWRSSKELG